MTEQVGGSAEPVAPPLATSAVVKLVCSMCGNEHSIPEDDFIAQCEHSGFPVAYGLSWEHPRRCHLRDEKEWSCAKLAGHVGACSCHTDCGEMNNEQDRVYCGGVMGHKGPHGWARAPQGDAAPRYMDEIVKAATALINHVGNLGDKAGRPSAEELPTALAWLDALDRCADSLAAAVIAYNLAGVGASSSGSAQFAMCKYCGRDYPNIWLHLQEQHGLDPI